MKSKGFGDTVNKITTATGIKKAVKYVFGDSCGCDERREKLNKLLPYKTKECLSEEEFMWCKGYFNTYRSTITRDEQIHMLEIYNRVYDAKKEASSCGSCVRDLYSQVEQLYKTYKNEIQ
jgi:hypothetical protein|tara:strand:- start:394 stop:753 length:360 start_codon:yes stop_codon:yes gene_type:complete